VNERPGAEKFHDDHKQMCEICRGLDEALVEAHARLSDRVAEVERLRELYGTVTGPEVVAGLTVRVEEAEAEVERLRAESESYRALAARRGAEVERLRAALNRAGDRLAQVQPGVTEPWAFDIVPKAEQEIADALGG
jgi:chromosome segregation ATPase